MTDRPPEPRPVRPPRPDPGRGGRPSRRRSPRLDPLEARALLDGAPAPAPIGDFDGDGRADPALYRFDPATGEGVFEFLGSASGTRQVVRVAGLSRHDLPIAGDFDGDGLTDAAVVRPRASLGGGPDPDATVWVHVRSSDGRRVEIPFGAPGTLDRPAPADYTGDGITDLATFRADSDLNPGAAEWFIRPGAGGPAFSVVFGADGGSDLPAPADYDGDGRADLATFRPSPLPEDGDVAAARWFVLPSGPNAPDYRDRAGGFRVAFGAPGDADRPVPADFAGDGRAGFAAFRPDGGLDPESAAWFVLPGQGAFPALGDGFPAAFGTIGSIAAVADYTGDGRPDYASYDPASASWTIAPAGPDGRPSPLPDRVSFGPTAGDAVPVLAPLADRLCAAGGLGPADPPAIVTVEAPPGAIPVYEVEVLNVYPHDLGAFTQGLAFADGLLYEGTGNYGESRLREVEPETGRVLREVALPDSVFGEGIALVGGRVVQLTWENGVGFVFDRSTFRPLGTFRYAGEGWGLAFDGTHLIMSDGSPTLRFLDPATFRVVRTLEVHADGMPVWDINELESVAGELFANIWHTDLIARIDPESGRVVGWVDLSGLRPRERIGPEAVPNGIAYDAAGDRLFVTGKYWSDLFQIRLVARG